jgi:2-dehydro-3-deoxyphosphogluconate aldolase/(4S)-4-hydroxy-2-oxoglutarate aldolase
MEVIVIEKLKEAGIVVALPGDLPLAAILPIVDALLASPILAVDVAFGSTELPQLLHDLRQRAGDKLLIGVSGVETAVQLQSLPTDKIDYISSSRLDDDLLLGCQTFGVAYLPGVISILAAQAAQQKGCSSIRLRTGGSAGADYVRAIRQVQPDLGVIVETELPPDDVHSYRQAGAAALVIGAPLFTGHGQTMADLITQARRFTQAWQNSSAEWMKQVPNGRY